MKFTRTVLSAFVASLWCLTSDALAHSESATVTRDNLSQFVMLDRADRLVCLKGVDHNALGTLNRSRVTAGARWKVLSESTKQRVALVVKWSDDPDSLTDEENQRLRRISRRQRAALLDLQDVIDECDELPNLDGDATPIPTTPTPRPTAQVNTPTPTPIHNHGTSTPTPRPTTAVATATPRPNQTATPRPVQTATPTPDHSGHTGGGSGPDLSTLPKGTEGITFENVFPTSERARGSNSRDTFRTRVAWTHYSYDDPIVYPGKQGAAHLHLFFGNALMDYQTTAENIRTRCKSSAAGGTANCSGYWIPALMTKDKNVVPPDFSVWYYKAGYYLNDPTKVTVPPTGLKMVIGKAGSTPSNPQTHSGDPLSGDLGAQRVFDWGNQGAFYKWNCTDRYETIKPYIPQDCAPGSILSLSLDFPMCWNGKDLDSADHISHMKFAEGGNCPASHPVPFPVITLNMEWRVPAGGTRGWHLSSDNYTITDQTPGGYSTHADWFNGWDPKIFERFNNNCNRTLQDCSVDILNDGYALGTEHQKPMYR